MTLRQPQAAVTTLFSGTPNGPCFLTTVYRKRRLSGYTAISSRYIGGKVAFDLENGRKKSWGETGSVLAIMGLFVSSLPVESGDPADFIAFWENGKKITPKPYWAPVDRFAAWAIAEGRRIDCESVHGWLEHLKAGGASASYLNGNFYACKCALLAWAEVLAKKLPRDKSDLALWVLDRELKAINLPTVLRGKRAKMVKEFRPEQLDQVIRGATPRIGAMIEFLADTGLRVSEMTGLRLKNIRRWDPDFSYVTVIGKGNKERSIFVQNTLLDRVRRTFQGKLFLFETSTNRPMDPDNVYKEIRRTFLRVAGMVLTPHNLRHYFATRQLQAGVSTKAVADYLGHSSPNTTSAWYDVSTIELDRLKTKHHGQRGRTRKDGGHDAG
jgi:integrase